MYYSAKFNVDECFRIIKSKVVQNQIQSEDCAIESLVVNGKTIISLCGNTTKQVEKAMRYANNCLYWSSDFSDIENVTSYAIYYPRTQPLLGTLLPNRAFDYKELTKIIFDQMIIKNDTLQSATDISNNLSDVIFFGHSAGGFVMNELMYNLGRILNEYEYSDDDIMKIYNSILFVGYSPFELVDYPIKSVYVAPVYDTVGSTQLVFNKLIRNGVVKTSDVNFDILKLNRYKNKPYNEFFRAYNRILNDRDTLYFAGDNVMVATPNLLYDDGIKEDHNLAGVVDYLAKNPHKTEAGENTTAFMHQVFNFGLSTERSKFNLSDLYQKVSDGLRINDIAGVNKEF